VRTWQDLKTANYNVSIQTSTNSTDLKAQDIVLNWNGSKNATKLNVRVSFSSLRLYSESFHSSSFTLVMDNAQGKVFARKKEGVSFYFTPFGDMKIVFHSVQKRNHKASNLSW